MADTPIEQKIAQAGERVEGALKSCDDSARAYIATVKSSLPVFFEEWMKREVARHPDEIQKLGAERLPKVKAEFKAFVDSIPALADKTFPTIEKWWHQTELPREEWSNNEPSILSSNGNLLDAELRKLLSPFGAILIRYGLSKSGYQQEWEGSPYTPKYRINPGFPKAVENAHVLYISTVQKAVRAKQEHQRLVDEKAKYDATALWDKA